MLSRIFLTSTLVVAALGPSALQAQTSPSDDWESTLTLYGWGAGLSGDLSVGERTAPVEVTAKDLLSSLDFALMFAFEVSNGKWTIDVDTAYANLGKEADLVSIQSVGAIDPSIELDARQTIVHGSVGYRVTEKLDLLAGVRGFHLAAAIDANVGRIADRSGGWVDPIVGARFRTALGDKWNFGLRGDIGGFGAGSELAWFVNLSASRRLTDRWSLVLGYRAWGFDYEGDRDLLNYEATMSGGGIGLTFRF